MPKQYWSRRAADNSPVREMYRRKHGIPVVELVSLLIRQAQASLHLVLEAILPSLLYLQALHKWIKHRINSAYVGYNITTQNGAIDTA